MSTIDTTSAVKDQKRFRAKHASKLRELEKKLHFHTDELDALILIYFKLNCDLNRKSKYISRIQFRDILYKCFNMPDHSMMERIMVAIDRGVTPYITVETWLRTMSLFLRGTLKEKIRFCFVAYDLLGEGLIKRDQMIQLMRHTMIKHHVEDTEEAVKDFVDILIKKLDVDLDGSISFDDYEQTVLKQPLMLECLGQCLPDRASIFTFQLTFSVIQPKF